MASSLAGRVAFVTGAASGLGRATAARFARAGARVVLFDLPSASASAGALAAELGGPRSAIFSAGDVTQEKEVRPRLT